MDFNFDKKFTPARRREFAQMVMALDEQIGFKVSARGWCYIMEQQGLITKAQFNKVADALNTCRKEGLLPVDFVAEEKAREFSGVEVPSEGTPLDTLKWMLRDVLTGHRYFKPDWWEGEDYYIQVVVEKIDLVTLFEPVCKEYHIPIANSKGWSSILQRAEYARRFKEAEDNGLQCVLLYCGDHDPDGLRISDTIRENLRQVADIEWEDGQEGYDPEDLIIDRIGLNLDFIKEHRLSWIDNLITGSKKNLADPRHPNFGLPYLQDYLKKIGERKCEANAIVTRPQAAADLIRSSIEAYLGEDARERFKVKTDAVKAKYASLLERSGLTDSINDALEMEDDDE